VTLLPIVERELRVASRRKSTYRIRSWTAAAAMLSFGSLITFLGALVKPDVAGRNLFTILTDCTFALCLLAGVFLTADCLSAEKREGTLGLLFLTDLKGYDVVLGKFAANSLNAFYGLLAVFPIMAIPLLLGGVTGEEFWRMTLALTNALFFSVAAGICFSALHRDARLAMSSTFAFLVILAGGLPAVARVESFFGLSAGWSRFVWLSLSSSIWDARDIAYRIDPRTFWYSLLATHLFGWFLVALASLALPHRWQERPEIAPAEAGPNWALGSSRESTTRRSRAPKEWLEINPVLWLIGRNRLMAAVTWAIVLAWGATMVVESLFAPGFGAALFGNFSLSRAFVYPLKVLFSLECCRFFADARRNGELEMLMGTPLTDREIIHGHRLALKRAFLTPLAVFAGLWLLPSAVRVFSGAASANFPAGLATAWINLPVLGRDAVDFLAIFYLGTWLALTANKPRMAAPLTILFALMLPLACCSFDVLPSLLIAASASSKLQPGVRYLVAQEYQRRADYAPSLATSKPLPAPPVIDG
jgi:ABC-type transport system involved in cytochrome c biogenesis permease component